MSHLSYIIAAYGLTLLGLGLFFGWTLMQWKKSIAQEKDSRGTLLLSNNDLQDQVRCAERIRHT